MGFIHFTPFHCFSGRATGDNAPGRGYFHTSGFSEVFGGNVDAQDSYAVQALRESLSLLRDTNYFLAVIWGDVDKGDKVMDLFTYNGAHPWPGNPEISAYVLRNGVYVPEDRSVTCEDTLIILGKEGEHRRQTRSLDDYISSPPVIELYPSKY
ncbi:MAG: hypothetical protein HY831_04300 [Candidatus Aenigmarchaeota archaeon]|nr:hypothetical protein [Candidatus Aenigmarchaeota archaeon]